MNKNHIRTKGEATPLLLHSRAIGYFASPELGVWHHKGRDIATFGMGRNLLRPLFASLKQQFNLASDMRAAPPYSFQSLRYSLAVRLTASLLLSSGLVWQRRKFALYPTFYTNLSTS